MLCVCKQCCTIHFKTLKSVDACIYLDSWKIAHSFYILFCKEQKKRETNFFELA